MQLQKASIEDLDHIWSILQDAINKRKEEGSEQWQDGYPNIEVIKDDIDKQYAYVFMNQNSIIGYVALIPNYEPAYLTIHGKWMNNTHSFLVIHRLAFSKKYAGKGLGKKAIQAIETYAIQQQFYSIKLDTNEDNFPMLRLMENLQYKTCGIVHIRSKERIAFEKIL